MIQIRCCEKRPAPLNSAWNNLLRPETVPAQLTTTEHHSVSTDLLYRRIFSRRRGILSLLHPPFSERRLVARLLEVLLWVYVPCSGNGLPLPWRCACFVCSTPRLQTTPPSPKSRSRNSSSPPKSLVSSRRAKASLALSG